MLFHIVKRKTCKRAPEYDDDDNQNEFLWCSVDTDFIPQNLYYFLWLTTPRIWWDEHFNIEKHRLLFYSYIKPVWTYSCASAWLNRFIIILGVFRHISTPLWNIHNELLHITLSSMMTTLLQKVLFLVNVYREEWKFYYDF